MPGPVIFSRIEQPNELTRLTVRSSDVWPLVRVAVETGESKILKVSLAAVLPRDHMVDAKCFVGRRSNMAVLATGSGALTNLSSNFPIHESRSFKATRAFDCRTANRFEMCR